jgi:dolichyl-phosphate beta-glucosyltransferase
MCAVALCAVRARARATPFPPLPPPPPRPRSSFTWEIIIVDDGSKDSTAALALREYVAVQGADAVRLLKCAANGGKGAAVRKGVMRARGAQVLMADADGATRFADVRALRAALPAGSAGGFAIGSRAHLFRGGKGQRSALRRALSWGFHKAVGVLLGGSDVEDTQCGFKLWTRGAARALFETLHIERWAFDVELVYIAARKGVRMAEVPVQWKEVAGSKLDPTSASLQMARDLIVVRLAYLFGWWTL